MLTADEELMNLIPGGVHHNRIDPAAVFPCVAFWTVRRTPVNCADNVQTLKRVVLQANIMTLDGLYDDIFEEMDRVFKAGGFTLIQTEDVVEDELFELAARYEIVMPLYEEE